MIDKSENRNPIYSELNFIVYFCLDCEAMVLDYKGKLCKDDEKAQVYDRYLNRKFL